MRKELIVIITCLIVVGFLIGVMNLSDKQENPERNYFKVNYTNLMIGYTYEFNFNEESLLEKELNKLVYVN